MVKATANIILHTKIKDKHMSVLVKLKFKGFSKDFYQFSRVFFQDKTHIQGVYSRQTSNLRFFQDL